MWKEKPRCHHFRRLKKIASLRWNRIIIIALIICTIVSGQYSLTHFNNPISTMVTLFLLACLLVVSVTFCVLKIPFSHETARIIEIFGYILLLLLLTWQLTVRDSLDSMSNHDYLEIKVDAIFEYLTSQNTDDKNAIFREYYYSVAGDEARSFLERELSISNFFVVGLQIISTLCIAIGRFDDISVKKKGKAIEELSTTPMAFHDDDNRSR